MKATITHRIRLGDMIKPGPLEMKTGIGKDHGDANYKGYLLAEFTYPIQPRRSKGAMWFYSHPDNEGVCHGAEKLFRDYLGAVKYGNIFSIDIGPDYGGKLGKANITSENGGKSQIRANAKIQSVTISTDGKQDLSL